ncbi:MAG: CapA family protein [Clostridium sp.]|nr:CapA family protein [Clostridiaceae bacterium]MDY5484932.1 CapA family protein [Clostridium sp.]
MSKNKTSIVFTGDIGFDRYMDRRWEDKNFLAKPVLDFFHSADHTVANVEGAMIDAVDDGSRGIFFHSMNPEAACILKQIHADIWSIGNNHTMDAGAEGVISTRTIAAEMGSQTIGAGLNEVEASEPVYLEEAGGIGMFCVAYQAECIPATATEPGIFRWDDMDYIAKRIAEIKSRCRWCIVVSHGGEEFTSLPSPYTRERYLKYLELGADVVVGHHPHVPENYELFDNGKAIFYSLGNFIFDTDYQRVHLYTDIGVLLKLQFTEEKMDFEAIGIQIVRGEERIDIAPLPDVFTDIPAEEYERLAPLSAKAFVEEDRRKMIYLEPERFTNAPEEVWNGYFFSEEPDGYFKGAHMDFGIIVPFSKKAEEGAWKQSRLEKVKEYILRQLP